MKSIAAMGVLWVILPGLLSVVSVARASVELGAGNSSLLGGDLTDPEDKVVDTGDYAGGQPEEKLRPSNATWVNMKCAPTSPPGTPPHQMHPYQSWQNCPACSIFLNKPADRKWYVGFKDGGKGGPTAADPYYCAIELKQAYVLTHFTITTSPDMPGRDPREWAIQGSDTGKDGEWTDIFKCPAKDRNETVFKEGARTATFLFASFTSADMAKSVSVSDLKKLQAKLQSKKIVKADFARQTKAYRWFRVVIYSCFNPNSMTYDDFNHPPGFALGQLELFGVAGAPAAKK